jgi:hypothetical protein
MSGMGQVWRHMRTDRSIARSKLDRGTIRRVLAFARPHRRLITGFLLLTVVDACLVVVTPLLVKQIVDVGIPDRTSGSSPGWRSRWPRPPSSAPCSPWGRATSPPASARA